MDCGPDATQLSSHKVQRSGLHYYQAARGAATQ